MARLRLNRFCRLTTVLSAVLLCDILFSVLFFQFQSTRSPFTEIPVTQAGLIFFGGANRDYTEMNRESLRRVNYALRLYRQGRVENLVCLGGAYHKRNYSGSQAMTDYLIQKGVVPEHIFTEFRSYDSYSNWEAACDIIRANQWHKVTLIASALHIQRLRKMITPTNDPAQIYFTGYDFRTENPHISFREIWYQAHYEWVAYLADLLLPQDIHRRLLRKMRQSRAKSLFDI